MANIETNMVKKGNARSFLDSKWMKNAVFLHYKKKNKTEVMRRKPMIMNNFP